jgi:ATP-dependent Lon protease
MPSSIQKMKNAKKNDSKKDTTTKKEDEKKYKKSNHKDSGSDTDSGNNRSDSENDGENTELNDQHHDKPKTPKEDFDIQEYRKMLAGMFPSKYMSDRVKALDQNQAAPSVATNNAVACKKGKKSTTTVSNKVDENKKVTRSTTKAAQEQKVDKKTNGKSKKKHSDDPPQLSSDDSTSSTSTTCSDDDSEDDEYSSGFDEFAKEQLKNGKFNIVINLVNDKNNKSKNDESDNDNSSQWETDEDDSDDGDDDDSEYDPEYDSEYDDSEEDYDDDDDESEYEEEEEEPIKMTIKTGSESKNKRTNDLISYGHTSRSSKSKKDRSSPNESQMTPESLETIQTIKKQMEEILKFNKHDKIAQETLNIMLNKEKDYKEREEKKLRTQKRHHLKSFKKLLRKKNSTNDLKYFKENLSTEEQTSVIQELEKLNKLTITDKPYRLALLQSDIPQSFKAIALKKITNLRYMEPGAGEYYKIKNWVDTFMQIPFGRFSNLPLTISDGIEKCHDFMEDAKSKLDGAVYGLNDAKMQIMQMLGQWISNPTAMGTAIAINGPMGTGKTSLVKEGISKILNREFAFVPLGGATDSSYLEGHSYTYEGSAWGKIVDILIRSKSMNPVIYFDELDKISETPKGEEIIGILTHLTDTSQNSQFHDKYFAEIDFDLSKCLFIFSYNDPFKVNPILLDRMYKIKTTGYQVKDKIVIAKQYLIPKIRYEVNFKEGDIIIPDSTLNYIIDTYTEKEDGVRNLKRCIEIIYKKLNLYRLVKPGTTLFDKEHTLTVEFPFTVTNDIVNNLIKKDDSGLNKSALNMYL